jgi:hypothetical protein
MEGSPPKLILGCSVCAVLNKELRKIAMAPFRCPMEWSPPALVLGCHIGAVLDEELCDIEKTRRDAR